MNFNTIEELYQYLVEDSKSKGGSGVWHETNIDGYHLYMADASFGYGPQLSIVGHNRGNMWGCETGKWCSLIKPEFRTITIEETLQLSSKANWVYMYEKLIQ
jgi:hypothetical protein